MLLSCKHQLVRNTAGYVERALSCRVERVPPADELVLDLADKPATELKTEEARKRSTGPNPDAPVSGAGGG